MTWARSAATSLLSSLALLCAISGSASATTTLGPAVSLDTLLLGGYVQADGLMFSMFSYSATGEMPGAELVNIIPIMDGDGFYGIRIQGGFLDTSLTQGASDALLSFHVSVLQGNPLINDVHLAGNPNMTGRTRGVVSVTETVNFEHQLEIFDEFAMTDSHEGNTQLVDWADIRPTAELYVLKDILAYAENGSATISFIDQTFSRVPEPGTLLLLGFGLSGLLVVGRRR